MAELQSKFGGTSNDTNDDTLSAEEELASAATGSTTGDIQGANLLAQGGDPVGAAVAAFGSGTAGGAGGPGFQDRFEASVKRFAEKSKTDSTTSATTTKDTSGDSTGDGESSTTLVNTTSDGTSGGGGGFMGGSGGGGLGGLAAAIEGALSDLGGGSNLLLLGIVGILAVAISRDS